MGLGMESRVNIVNVVPVKRRPRVDTRGGHPRAYTPAKTVAEERLVAESYKGERYSDPVCLTVHIYRALPKSRPKRIESEPDTTTPDIDNVVKAIMDALNELAYDDDAQVVELHAYKHDRTRRAGDCVRYTVTPA